MSQTPPDNSSDNISNTVDTAEEHAATKNFLESLGQRIAPEPDLIANLATIAAVVSGYTQLHWVGFYRKLENELLLGPFQGPPAQTRIAIGHGVCGAAAMQGKSCFAAASESVEAAILQKNYAELAVPLSVEGQVKLILAVAASDASSIEPHRLLLEETVALLKRKYTI